MCDRSEVSAACSITQQSSPGHFVISSLFIFTCLTVTATFFGRLVVVQFSNLAASRLQAAPITGVCVCVFDSSLIVVVDNRCCLHGGHEYTKHQSNLPLIRLLQLFKSGEKELLLLLLLLLLQSASMSVGISQCTFQQLSFA